MNGSSDSAASAETGRLQVAYCKLGGGLMWCSFLSLCVEPTSDQAARDALVMLLAHHHHHHHHVTH
jgi:hypothetical protein